MKYLVGRSILATLVGCSAFAQGSSGSSSILPANSPANSKSAKPIEELSNEPDRTYKADLFFNLQGKRFDDAVVNSRYSMLMIGFSLEANYREWLAGKLSVFQFMTSGQASNLYSVTEEGAGSGTLLDEASISVMPARGLKASAGVLRLEINPIYSQMMPQNNAGGSAELQYKGRSGSIGLEASQSIPTSRSISNRTTDEDTLPMLTIGNVNMELESKALGFKLKAAAARFIFTDLSSQSAADSQQIGSTTIGNGKGGFLFAYDFRGTEYAAQIEQKIFLADQMMVKASTVKNELAPAAKNSGWQGRFEYKKSFNKWALIPSYTRFRLESDALPAAYSWLTVGYANRNGAAYGLKVDFPKEKFSVFGGYTNSKVIDPNSTAGIFQADREIYTLGVEARYDIL